MRKIKALRTVALLLISGILSACNPPPTPWQRKFPIGIYGADRPEELAALADAGFDTIHSYEAEPEKLVPLAREAKLRGLRMLAYASLLKDAPAARVRDWPVDAWYAQDEPDTVRMSTSTLVGVISSIKSWDSSRPVTFVVGSGEAARKFGPLADILMLDWYPVPHRPLDSVADQLDTARSHTPASTPIWMVLQAFNWARLKPLPQDGEFPSFPKLRFMAYASILHGAKGIFFFTLNQPGGASLLERPEEFQAVTRLARELQELKPLLERGRILEDLQRHGHGLESRQWEWRGRRYCILINRTNIPTKLPPEFIREDWRPLFEPRRYFRELVTPTGRDWFIPPFRAFVLEKKVI